MDVSLFDGDTKSSVSFSSLVQSSAFPRPPNWIQLFCRIMERLPFSFSWPSLIFFFSSKKTKKHKEFFKKDKNWSSFFLWRILFVLLRCSPCRHRLFRRREWEVEKDKNDDKINHSFDESLGRFWERKRKHIYTNCKKKQNETTNWTRTALVL